MNELDRWMNLLLNKGVSAEGLREFESIYKDMIYSTAINEELDVMRMFDIIDMMGDDNTDSEMMRRYLYYIYGKFLVADIYAGIIGDMMGSVDKDERMMLEDIMELAIDKIIKQ